MTRKEIEQELAELEQRTTVLTYELGIAAGKREVLRRLLAAAEPVAAEPPAKQAGPLGLVGQEP